MEECEIRQALMANAEELAEKLIHKLKDSSITLALAESCTAGLVSGLLAKISGASAVLWGSFVCYTPEAKVSMLGLDLQKITEQCLVSRETACQMAEGALKKSGAGLAAAVTGLAGPEGDGSGVPVGTVWVAAAGKGRTAAQEYHFEGGRNTVRVHAAIAVLETVLQMLENL